MLYKERANQYADLAIHQAENGNMVVMNPEGEEIINCECDHVKIMLRKNLLFPFLARKPIITLERRFYEMAYVTSNLKKPVEPKFKPHGIVFGKSTVGEFVVDLWRNNAYDDDVIREKLSSHDEIVNKPLINKIKVKRKAS